MTISRIWDDLLHGMESRIGHQDVEIWLRSATPIRFEQGDLTLEVANRYYAEWITDNYLNDLQAEATRLTDQSVALSFIFREDPTAEVPRPKSNQTAKRPPRAIGVNSTQTFQSFVVGECNKFAHAAAAAVADNPATNYNPLFIYGSTGLGKTHLMHAVANVILQHDASARVVYVTAEDFMNEMIDSLRYKRMEDFRSKYRKQATVLLVDDIQFLSGKDRTQEEFFHTFNALQNSGRQVILTADVLPRNIEKLEPRLRTRFEGGLLADMQMPDQETMLAILLQKADAQRLVIPVDLAQAIVASVAGNVRELEGVLNRLAALQSFYNQPLTLSFASKQFPNLFISERISITVPSIIEAVARFHNIRSPDITGNKRTRTLTRPRHIAMYLARQHTSLSFPELGKEFGGRDHSTIQHGCRKVEKEMKNNSELSYKIQMIEQGLNIR